jgi:O-antigen ligase
VKPSRGKPRRPVPAPTRTGKAVAAPTAAEPPDLLLATFFLWLLVLVPPFLFAPMAKESFRLPKLMASEWLALASLACLAWGLRRVVRVRISDLWRLPAVRSVLPVLVVATVGLAATRHLLHARQSLVDLWIGGVALVGWSAGVPAARLERLLLGLLWPAAALGAIGILQFHGLWRGMVFFGLAPGSRLAVTSLAGNPGDLGAYLVLPALLGQASLRRRLREGEAWSRPAVWGTAAALAVSVYALLITQTLAAVAGLAAGSLVLWGSQLRRRRAVLALAGGALAAVLLVTAVPPLRHRIVDKGRQAAAGDWNSVLTGRLDGWRAAVWMFERHPLTGVGHGGYLPEFVPAKLALLDRGVRFVPHPSLAVFSNAHNELLTAAAEWGLPGLIAAAWGLWMVVRALRRMAPEERVLGGAGVAALTLLALAAFPFHVALVAYPALLFLSWVLRPPVRQGDSRQGGIPGRTLAVVLTLVLALALAAQTVRWRNLALANRLLGTVEKLSMAMSGMDRVPARIVAQNLAALSKAAALDPVQVGIPFARGGQYLFFLERPQEAEQAYLEALRLEPQPKAYFGLGRAQWLAGRKAEALRNFQLAVRLDPSLAAELPPEAR